MSDLPIGFADVQTAAGVLSGATHRTPVLTSRTADEATGAQVFCKAENLQRGGSFKIRGAYNRLAAIRESPGRGVGSVVDAGCSVVAGSSGNHAQGVALAARMQHMSATIVMPADAPAVKRAAVESYGAEVVTFDRQRESREDVVARVHATRGGTVIPAYDDPLVMAGQGTVALELAEQAPDLDVVLIPLGGGGLCAGCATVLAHVSPATRIIGVEPVGADDWARSLPAGRRVRIDPPGTVADGVRAQEPGALTWPVVSTLVERVVLVDDEQILAAMRFALVWMKTLVEPSGAVALAAVLFGAIEARGARVGVVLSGGNADADTIERALARDCGSNGVSGPTR